VGVDLTRKLDVNYVLDIALDAAMRLSYAHLADIVLVEGDHLRIAKVLGRYEGEMEGMLLDKKAGIIGRVIQTGEPVLVHDVNDDPDYVALLPDMCTEITIPLRTTKRIIGVLNLETKNPERFTEGVFEALNLLATNIAIAIDNAMAYEERDRLVQELDSYAHTVAHDLKSPLALITGYITMIQSFGDRLTPDELADDLDTIERTTNKMTTIIDGLLLLASVRKLDDVRMDPLDMASIVSEAQRRLAGTIDEAGAEIISPETWPIARGYPLWVEEIWANYISNAVKYGGSPPCVALGATVQADGMVRFWARDNGRGLSEEEQAQLFVQFSRLSQTRVEGHGLGLSIVRRIVERLGGEAGVESEKGKGSTFWFTLPAVDEG
jgi:signal transduction histidine kinase